MLKFRPPVRYEGDGLASAIPERGDKIKCRLSSMEVVFVELLHPTSVSTLERRYTVSP
jgi:hypothetical protein